ncbi:hypothetical protein BDV28DRAFT_141750 [Aspergillus coremiiformis]|uniref:Uncharacterized protein n=1 Tax=Aspergillus coremiiformis TaxID=138285 RepID=A0A5N6YUK9_9EURO|nr:hypothetical protein BDV28DRAFT_141750 [Aspergillus coremiiformis]
MPIKLPKGFARRKSSGNALEEVENPPQQSFRVFERPSVEKKSYSEGNILAKRLSDGQRFYPTTEESDNIFAGIDNPGQRNPESLHERPKSARLHSSTHRSADGVNPSDTQIPHSRNQYDIPIPPLSGALRAAGRTFSFGGRFSKASAPTPPPPPPHQPSTPGPSRSRAMTASTTSTATPPKLLNADLEFDQEDKFHNMFNEVGKQATPRDRSGDMFSSSPEESAARKQDRIPRPTPINTDRSKEVEPSPYSWDSRHSEEGLLMEGDSLQYDTSTMPQTLHSHPISTEERTQSLPLSSVVTRTTTSHRSLEKPQAMNDKGLRRSVVYANKRASTPVEDEDAKLIMESLYTSKRSSQVLLATEHEDSDAENNTALFDNYHAATADRSDAVPMHAHKSLGIAEEHLDPSIAAHARLAAQYEERQPATTAPSNKVMTPSQFEHYRQQQELRRSTSNASKSDESAESDFDEEDEAEKNREVERQRRKQEAHLSVYRQQMMKVTGQESSASASTLRPEVDRVNNSAPNLTVTPLNSGNKSGSGKSSEGDEDEEIPLGILAAHGFPNRNRPPSRLAPSNSIPNLRASFHQPYISSSSSLAEHEPDSRSSLPVFARNLPRDPYFGAGLVNHSNRESLALGGGSSIYGGPSTVTGPPQPALPPGGLVGVIATEERARAMRRGSPNTQAIYEYQNGASSVPVQPGGIPRPFTMMSMNPPAPAAPPQAISATEQAQIQLSQQMSSMMQVQMQWMQQMIQMQGGQVPPQQFAPPAGFPSTPAATATMRPSSMPSAGGINNAPAGYRNDQRTLSMLDPNVSSRLNSPAMPYNVGGNRPSTPAGQGYAPSIAPSERSNIGLAPRYRPVSMLPPEPAPAAYPFPSKPWNDENQKSTLSVSSPNGSHPTKTAAQPISRGDKPAITSKPGHSAEPEEDDDEGWAEMMKKREKNRSNWKMKKETSSFGDLLNAVH